MVIVGFDLIGKTSSCGGDILELSEGSFVIDPSGINADWHRPNGWEEILCNIATHLSAQGFTVLLSASEEIVTYFNDMLIDYIAVFPSENLEKEWIQRYYERFKRHKTEYNEQTYKEACVNTRKRIEWLHTHATKNCILTNTTYDLKEVLATLKAQTENGYIIERKYKTDGWK